MIYRTRKMEDPKKVSSPSAPKGTVQTSPGRFTTVWNTQARPDPQNKAIARRRKQMLKRGILPAMPEPDYTLDEVSALPQMVWDSIGMKDKS